MAGQVDGGGAFVGWELEERRGITTTQQESQLAMIGPRVAGEGLRVLGGERFLVGEGLGVPIL